MLQYFYKKLEASWIFTLVRECQDQVSQRQHKETEVNFCWSQSWDTTKTEERPGRWADGLPRARRGAWAGFCSPHSALRDANGACVCVPWHKLVSGMLLPSLLLLGRLGALTFLSLHGHQTLSLSCSFSPQVELYVLKHLVCLRLE